MTITIGSATFDDVSYDAEADVLCLHEGDPSTTVEFDESPEGHALRSDGELVGLTIIGARALVDAGLEITITLSQTVQIDSDTVARALVRTLAAAAAAGALRRARQGGVACGTAWKCAGSFARAYNTRRSPIIVCIWIFDDLSLWLLPPSTETCSRRSRVLTLSSAVESSHAVQAMGVPRVFGAPRIASRWRAWSCAEWRGALTSTG
jgi:hypothetical protein